MASRPRGVDSPRYSSGRTCEGAVRVTVRLSASEVARLDALLLPGESGAERLRRLLGGVATQP